MSKKKQLVKELEQHIEADNDIIVIDGKSDLNSNQYDKEEKTKDVYERLGYLEYTLIAYIEDYKIIRDYFRYNYTYDDFLQKENSHLFEEHPKLFLRLKRSFKMKENTKKK